MALEVGGADKYYRNLHSRDPINNFKVALFKTNHSLACWTAARAPIDCWSVADGAFDEGGGEGSLEK